MRYPIFIPSKGRADYQYAKLIRILDAEGVKYTIFVEKEDELMYRAIFGRAKIAVHKESNKGIGYARQSMLNYARENNIPVYWQLDDNIYGFYRAEAGKMKRTTATECIEAGEAIFERLEGVGLLALDYQQFAWSHKVDWTLNRGTWCSTLTRSDTGINYASDLDTREDVDFCLQHLLNGWDTVLVHKFAMAKPTMAMNKVGGLSQRYKEGQGKTGLMDLVEKYKSIEGLVGTKEASQGRGLNIKINWKHFKREPRYAISK